MTIEKLSLDKITEDDSLQIREHVNRGLVNTYRALMKNGPLAPVDVFKIGSKYFVVDGWHRLSAARILGWPDIECTVHKGKRRDALLFAAGCNGQHGQPLTRGEKTRAIEMLLEDAEWFQWSDRKIAKHCGVSAPTVGRVRDRMLNERGGSLKKSYSEKRKRTDKHGHESTINTANIGRKPKTPSVPGKIVVTSVTTPPEDLIASAFGQLAAAKISGGEAFRRHGAKLSPQDEAAVRFVMEYAVAREASRGAA